MNHYDTPTQASIAKRKNPMPYRPISSTFSEIYKLKKTLKDLKRDANEQLKVEIESQKTFDYLTSQIKTLRDAIIPIADVLVEEVDVAREEFIQRNKELEEKVNGLQNQTYQMETEITFLKSEINACKSRLDHSEMLNGSSVQAQEKISKMMEEMLKSTNNQLITQTLELADKVDSFGVRQERMEDDFSKVKKILKEVKKNLGTETAALHQSIDTISENSKNRESFAGLATTKLESAMEVLQKNSEKGLTALATDILTISEKQKEFSEQLEQLQINFANQQKNDSDKVSSLVMEQETNFKHNFDKLSSSIQLLSNKVKGNMITLQEQIQQVSQEITDSKGGALENSNKIEKKVNALQSAVQQIIESVTLTGTPSTKQSLRSFEN